MLSCLLESAIVVEVEVIVAMVIEGAVTCVTHTTHTFCDGMTSPIEESAVTWKTSGHSPTEWGSEPTGYIKEQLCEHDDGIDDGIDDTIARWGITNE